MGGEVISPPFSWLDSRLTRRQFGRPSMTTSLPSRNSRRGRASSNRLRAGVGADEGQHEGSNLGPHGSLHEVEPVEISRIQPDPVPRAMPLREEGLGVAPERLVLLRGEKKNGHIERLGGGGRIQIAEHGGGRNADDDGGGRDLLAGNEHGRSPQRRADQHHSSGALPAEL